MAEQSDIIWSCSNTSVFDSEEGDSDEEDGEGESSEYDEDETESIAGSDTSHSDNSVFSEDELCSEDEWDEGGCEDVDQTEIPHGHTVSESSDEDTESDEAYDEDSSDEDDLGDVDQTEIHMASESSDEDDDEGDSDVDDGDQTEIEEGTNKLCLPSNESSPTALDNPTHSTAAPTLQNKSLTAEPQVSDYDTEDEEEGVVIFHTDCDFHPIHPPPSTTITAATLSGSELGCWQHMLESAVQQCSAPDTPTMSRTSSEEELTSIFYEVCRPTPIRSQSHTSEGLAPTKDGPPALLAGSGWTKDSYREHVLRTGLHFTGSAPHNQFSYSGSKSAFTPVDVHNKLFMECGQHTDLVGSQQISAPPANLGPTGATPTQPRSGHIFSGAHFAYSAHLNDPLSTQGVYATQPLTGHTTQAFSTQPSCGHFGYSGMTPSLSTASSVRDPVQQIYCDTLYAPNMYVPTVSGTKMAAPTLVISGSHAFGYTSPTASAALAPQSHSVTTSTPATRPHKTEWPSSTETLPYLSNALLCSSLDLPVTDHSTALPPSLSSAGCTTSESASCHSQPLPQPPTAKLTPPSVPYLSNALLFSSLDLPTVAHSSI